MPAFALLDRVALIFEETTEVRRFRFGVLLGLSFAMNAAFASNHIVEIRWADGRFVHAGRVEAGKFVEVCGKFKPGDQVRWRFASSAAVDFNIHYHVGKQTVFPAKHEQVTSGSDTLKVTAEEDHCWMWRNKAAVAVNVDVELQR